MNNNIESLFRDYCSISQRVQLFEEKLKNADVSSEMRPELHNELEVIHTELEGLQQITLKAGNAFSAQLVTIQEQVVSLYGQIEDRFENYTVTCIAREALKLGSLIENGQMTRVAALADELKGHIQFLFSERLPSLQNRKIIHIAQKLAEAGVSQESKAKLYSIQLIGMLKALIQEAIEQTEQLLPPEEAELAMELYEIADLYSHHYATEARHRLKPLLHRLPAHRLQGDLSDEEYANRLIEVAQDMTQVFAEPRA